MSPKDALIHALPRFLRRCDAKSTKQAYERELRRFLAWLSDTLHEETLFDYRDHLREKRLGATTVRWRTTVVRAFLQFAKRRRYLEKDAVADFKPPKGKVGFAPRVLTQGELDRLMAAPDRRTAQGRRDAAVLVCMGVGGLRVGEVCRLNAQDVLIRQHEVVLTVYGKGNKQRLVTLPGNWVGQFQSYLRVWPKSRRPFNPFFWCGPKGDRRITPAAVDYLVKRAGTAAEVPGLHPHALRHTAATLGVLGGETLPAIKAKLGHSSIVMTIKYLHLEKS